MDVDGRDLLALELPGRKQLTAVRIGRVGDRLQAALDEIDAIDPVQIAVADMPAAFAARRSGRDDLEILVLDAALGIDGVDQVLEVLVRRPVGAVFGPVIVLDFPESNDVGRAEVVNDLVRQLVILLGLRPRPRR